MQRQEWICMLQKGSIDLEACVTCLSHYLPLYQKGLISQHISELEWECYAQNQKSSIRIVLKSLGFLARDKNLVRGL